MSNKYKEYIVNYLKECGIIKDELYGEEILKFKKDSDWCELVAEDIIDTIEKDFVLREEHTKFIIASKTLHSRVIELESENKNLKSNMEDIIYRANQLEFSFIRDKIIEIAKQYKKV